MNATVRSVGWWAMLFLGIFLLFGSVGCAPMDAGSLAPLMKQTADILADKIEKEGVLDKFVTSIEGDLHDPGIVIETGLILRSTIYLKGTHGEVELSGEGHGTQLSESTRTALEAELGNPQLTIVEKQKIIEFLVGLQNAPTETPVGP